MPQFVAGMLEDLLQLCKFIAIKRVNTCGTTALREAKIIANTTDYTYEIFTGRQSDRRSEAEAPSNCWNGMFPESWKMLKSKPGII